MPDTERDAQADLGTSPIASITSPIASIIGRWAAVIGAVSTIGVLVALVVSGSFSDKWLVQLTIVLAVAVAPQFPVDWIARAAEAVAKEDIQSKKKRTVKRGFDNLGAWVGVLERPLLLAALLGGFPEFIAGWYVLKGVGGYRIGLQKKQRRERRIFQLFLINSAVSFSGVALGLLAWHLLGLPTYSLRR